MENAKCSYSIKFLPLIDAKLNELGWDGLKTFMIEFFEDGENAYLEYASINQSTQPNVENEGQVDTIIPGTSFSIEKPNYEQERINNRGTKPQSEEKSILDFYIGKQQDLTKMQARFKSDIVRLSVFDKDANNNKGLVIDANAETNGISNLNKNILKYKLELINSIRSIANLNLFDFNDQISDEEFHNQVAETISIYESLSSKHKEKLLNEYVILTNFDNLLKQFANFIQIKPEYKNYDKSIVNKYVYKGANVKFDKSWSLDETADAFKEASDLARILLDTFPEVVIESNGSVRPLEGTSINLVGFTSAMSTIRTALISPPQDSVNIKFSEIVDEFYKGSAINMSKVISTYIDYMNENRNITDKTRTYLINKLNAIKYYIYDSNLSPEIKNIFTAMFYKNVPVSYMAYQYDNSLQEIAGRELDSTLVDTHKSRLRDLIAATVDQLRENPKLYESIIDKYGINITENKITFNYNRLGTNLTSELNYEYVTKGGNSRYVFTPVGQVFSNDVTEELIKDLLYLVLPENTFKLYTQINGLDEKNASLFQMFSDIIGLTLTASNQDPTLEWRLGYQYKDSGLLDLSTYGFALENPAKVFSIIYGADCISVIRNASGNSLPTTQLICLSNNFHTLRHKLQIEGDAVFGQGYYNIYQDNLLFANNDLLVSPLVRNDVTIKGVNKKPSELTFNEVMQLAIVNDFFQQINKNDRINSVGTIYLQNTTFSDKNTHWLPGYKLNGKIKDTTLGELINTCINTRNSDRLTEIFRQTRAAKINSVAENIIYDYQKAFGIDFKTLKEIDQYLLDNEIEEYVLEAYFKNKVDLYPDIHYYVPKNTKIVRINETILNWQEVFNDPIKTNIRLNRNRNVFAKNLISNGLTLNKFTNKTILSFANTVPDWVDNKTGKITLFEAYKNEDGKLIPIDINVNNADILLDKNIIVKLHPIIEAYFMSDILLSNEYNSLMIGEIYAHPNKVKYDPKLSLEDYYEFSEANRLIAQNKRAVILGATHHPFLQGLDNGVAENIRIAVVKDIAGDVQNIIGDSTTVDSMDGSGFSHPIQARLENNSLLDARVGYDKKTIMHDMDVKYGRPTLLKWAVYALTNARRRMSWAAEAPAENVYKKMSDGRLRNVQYTKEYEEYINKFGHIYFKDSNTGKLYKIISVDNFGRNIIEVDEYGRDVPTSMITYQQMYQNSLYDTDQLFGGAWAMSLQNGKLEFSEANLDILESIIVKYKQKDTFIGYLVNKSAIKVGAGNINSSYAFYNDKSLTTIKMSTKFGGVQMDADHDLDLSHVTEMTQMLSALIQGGHSTELVDKIYKEIGENVNEALSKFNIAIDTKDNVELYRLLGSALIEAFTNNDRDTLGLAQAFITKANESLQKVNIDFKLPFSAPTVKGAFISTVVSLLNKKGIRRKYAGFAGVLVPSHDMIMYHSIGGKNYSYEGLIKKFSEIRQKNPLLANATNQQFLNEYNINGVINPFLRKVNQNNIDFEDTVIIVPKNQIPTESNVIDKIKISDFAYYDDIKNRDLSEYDIYIFDTKPKNLKGFDVKFVINVNGKNMRFSTYDLPSVRLSYLINNAKKRQKNGILNTLNQQQLIDTYVPNTYTGNDWNLLSDQDKLKYLSKETANVLKALKYKTLFNFGKYGMVQAISTKMDAAQVIMGRNYARQFGLKAGDEISEILEQGSSFFKSRMISNYKLPDNIDKTLYDAILYTGDGKQILVKYGDKYDITEQFKNVPIVTEGNSFKIVNGSVYYNDQEFTNTDQKQFYQITDEYGETHDLIVINNIERLNQLRKSSLFDTYRLNYTNENVDYLSKFEFTHQLEDDATGGSIKIQMNPDRKISFDKATYEDFAFNEAFNFNMKLNRLAAHKFDSFKKSLNFVGARIPTQAMQSFMPIKVVAFSDSEVNDIYVPKQQTWLQGSDYKHIVIIKSREVRENL